MGWLWLVLALGLAAWTAYEVRTSRALRDRDSAGVERYRQGLAALKRLHDRRESKQCVEDGSQV